MMLVFVAALMFRGQEARVPVPPYTLAAKMSYLVESSLLDEFDVYEWQSQRASKEKTCLERETYRLQQRISADGDRCSVIEFEGKDLMEG